MAETAVNHGNTTPNTTASGDSTSKAPEYVAFVLVPIFFLLGLLGVLICHILKRKGYKCTTESEGDTESLEGVTDPEPTDLNNSFSGSNNDTVNQIVHYIMKNEANSDALKAMLHQNSVDSEGVSSVPGSPVTPNSPSPPMTPVSPGAPPFPFAARHTCSHLHTIGGMGGHKNICARCNQKKWPVMRRTSSRGRSERRSRHGEVTVLSVGRFRVTKCDPKTTKERRTLIISETNGTEPSSPATTEPRSRIASEQQEETDIAK